MEHTETDMITVFPIMMRHRFKVLEGLEAVRKRPEHVYRHAQGIKGLHQLIYEVVDNSIDETMAGFCDRIHVVIHKDLSVTVSGQRKGSTCGIHLDG